MTDALTAIDKMSFEAALAELEAIVRDLETGKTSLEKSISSYERGVALKTHCETKLLEAQSKIEKIIVTPDGRTTTAPLDND
ncbi:MAG: exodeoxyribonuclease VII small subunit [Alphaproteobacteria bacterium]|jgi:exodeoxyribonuclease VII small subunit|nr:exodeoxyribonuclease VII small subunit [Alphaproteobacteria bacterium]MBP9050592.1 exodeoxyribonuclease VII small subunit [Alphaproteobacteria bacterium]MBP9868437.1 exodeoxyribonuclease VII small subunit [Alphaproteobacteria bacterium]